MLNLQENAQFNPPIQSSPSTFHLTTPPSQSNGAVFMQNTNGRSFDCYDTSMSSNPWNSYNLNICIFTTLYSYKL